MLSDKLGLCYTRISGRAEERYQEVSVIIYLENKNEHALMD